MLVYKEVECMWKFLSWWLSFLYLSPSNDVSVSLFQANELMWGLKCTFTSLELGSSLNLMLYPQNRSPAGNSSHSGWVLKVPGSHHSPTETLSKHLLLELWPSLVQIHHCTPLHFHPMLANPNHSVYKLKALTGKRTGWETEVSLIDI